jgi:hypothetical protein
MEQANRGKSPVTVPASPKKNKGELRDAIPSITYSTSTKQADDGAVYLWLG